MAKQQQLAGDAALLRIYIGSRDKIGMRNLYEVIVEEAREAGLAGATVYEGFMGFGANSVVHRTHIWGLSQDLPVVLELVDEESRIRDFLPRLKVLLPGGGLITLQKLQVLHYQGEKSSLPEAN
jgi:PII-like signaling protein